MRSSTSHLCHADMQVQTLNKPSTSELRPEPNPQPMLFLSGSISSFVENGLLRKAMHPESRAALRTVGFSFPVWADGIHLQARLEDEKQCILVLIGATPEGRKELVAPSPPRAIAPSDRRAA